MQATQIAIRKLTKAHIIELRRMIKPHHLVEKVLTMVCYLKGCIAPSWSLAREILSSMTFKIELVLLDPTKIKQGQLKKVIQILTTVLRLLRGRYQRVSVLQPLTGP